MNKKVLMTIALILLVFISLAIFTSPSFAEDDGRSYSIPFADIHLYIQEDGSLHVVETIHYVFSGTYRGVTRDIPFKSNEIIENLNVTTEGAYSTFKSTNDGGTKHITVYLYSNPEKTSPVTDTEVDVTYEYDFLNVIKLYNDGATLQYNLWGDEWDKNLGTLNAYIHLNDKNDVKYWINPSEFILANQWNNNTIEATTEQLPSGQLLELRMIIPKDYFNNATHALIFNEDGIAAFENLQKEYEDGVRFFTPFYEILAAIMLLLCLFPVLIYFKYGRQPKISYQGVYERELPTNDSPAIVNALYRGNVGSVNMDAFKASVLSLVSKKYILMENFENVDKGSKDENSGNPTISFINDSDFADLSPSEEAAFNTLKMFADNNAKLDLELFKKDMKNEMSAKRFRDYYNSWVKKVENEAEKGIEKFFDSTGSDYGNLLALGGLVLSGILIILWFFNWLPFSYVSSFIFLFPAVIALIFVSVVTIVIPNHILGRWTLEGKENEKKWSNFRKYLLDFSLIKEHPPSSVEIWGQYLVYGTTLGLAKTVQKSMEKLIPKETLNSMDSYYFYTYAGSYYLFSSFDTGISTATSADSGGGSGGSGGFGGGSGGGGGGAF